MIMRDFSRRQFIQSTFTTAGVALGAMSAPRGISSGLAAEGQKSEAAESKPETLFLTWQRDPTTTMTIQWIGNESEIKDPSISFAVKGKADPRRAATKIRPFPTTDQKVFRAELTDLTPGTEYEFRIGSQSPVYRFRTMPGFARSFACRFSV
jgi:phosphodiesterase/alkaline phosphatase D-like protein